MRGECVDFKNLNDRLKANSVHEKSTNLWPDRVFGKEDFKKRFGMGLSGAALD